MNQPAGGLYELPLGINISFNFNAREGWIIREYLTFYNGTLPNPASRTFDLDLTPFGSDRLLIFYNLSLRLEKMIASGAFGRIYIMADLFNALNTSVENRRFQKWHGTYYYYGEGHPSNKFVPYVLNYNLNEILNPRVARLGVRFVF